MASEPSADPQRRDPIELARDNWERAGWGGVANGMVAVTSVMRAHQILLARVENALRPYDLSFARYELLRLLAFSRNGALPITKASDRLQVHVTSVTHAIRRLEANGLVTRLPHPTDGHANFVYLPAGSGPWRQLFDNTGLQVRHYADGSVRITVGNRKSTRAVLSALAPFTTH